VSTSVKSTFNSPLTNINRNLIIFGIHAHKLEFPLFIQYKNVYIFIVAVDLSLFTNIVLVVNLKFIL